MIDIHVCIKGDVGRDGYITYFDFRSFLQTKPSPTFQEFNIGKEL